MSTMMPQSDGIEADKLLDLDVDDILEYEAWDAAPGESQRTKREYQKRVTNISRLSATRVYVHVVDLDTDERTILAAKTKHDPNGILKRTGSIEETLGPHATHPDAWTRDVTNLTVLGD